MRCAKSQRTDQSPRAHWTQQAQASVRRGRSPVLPSRVIIGYLFLIWTFPAALSASQPNYVPRNNWEVYLPYLTFDPFPSLSSAQERLLRVEYGRRALAVTWHEARVNRPFYVDMSLESVASSGMPMEPLLWQSASGEPTLTENAYEQPDAAFRLEAHYTGQSKQRPPWRVSVDVATRFHLIKTDIPAEAALRVSATHWGTRDEAPLGLGFFVGPEVKPMYFPIAGLSLGGYFLLSPNQRGMTRGSLILTAWSDSDLFENLIRLRLGHEISLARRRVAFDVTGGIDARKVDPEQYEELLLETAPTSRYVDVFAEVSGMAILPGRVRLGLSGRYVAFHTPDERIVRWYRSVAPEISVALARKFGVLDLSAAYTLSWVPPLPVAGVVYDDSGQGVVPGSSMAQQGSVNASLRF